FLNEVEKIPIVAKCDVTVLICGETGTGKELFARAVHYLSPRADKPFIPLNCGAIPAELAENELFGHIKGAFTGANSPQLGLVHEAHGGTLFLDEIDCLPLSAQVKLLRFLQDKEYRQLGSTKISQVDVRIIAATNTDLEKALEEGRFRKDLFYRLNVIPFALPPLRERREDILLLAQHFLAEYAFEFNKNITDFSPGAMQKLLLYKWHGNIRELENVIQRAVIFSNQATIQDTEIVLPAHEDTLHQESFKTAKSNIISQFEKNYIHSLLLIYQGNITKAAKSAKKNRRAFYE
ncbi:MAG: sigma-54-dependent Fis family transcriptional regulator, partial [Nitrospirae bacterium]|nr:sigma-54-dependent Fis family transcriptional regulator [Nitrospirota bacterium]